MRETIEHEGIWGNQIRVVKRVLLLPYSFQPFSFPYSNFKGAFKRIDGMRCCVMLKRACSHSPDIANNT